MLPPFTQFVHSMPTKPESPSRRLDNDLRTIVEELTALSHGAANLGLDGLVARLGYIKTRAYDARKNLEAERAERVRPL